MNALQELVGQFEQGLLTPREFWARVAELALAEHAKTD